MTNTPKTDTTTTPISDLDIIRDALKWASCVELGDSPKQSENREKFYQPAKDALGRIESKLQSLEYQNAVKY